MVHFAVSMNWSSLASYFRSTFNNAGSGQESWDLPMMLACQRVPSTTKTHILTSMPIWLSLYTFESMLVILVFQMAVSCYVNNSSIDTNRHKQQQNKL